MAIHPTQMYLHYYERAVQLNREKRYRDALNMLMFAIQLKPSFHKSWYERGVALEGENRHDDALLAYTKAIELRADYHHALFAKCGLLSKLHRNVEALDILHELARQTPDDPKLWFEMNFLYRKLGMEDLADEALNRGMDLNPKEARIWYFKAMFLASVNDRTGMLENLRRAIETDYRFSEEALSEEAFEPFRHEPEFQALTHVDPAAMYFRT